MTDCTDHPLWTLSVESIEALCDRLISRGSSHLATYSPGERSDLVLAARTIRALLRRYQKATGRQLHTIVVEGR